MTLKIILYLVGALVGGLGGFLFWKYVGCTEAPARSLHLRF